ncbi:MAG TPA: hypothetical protein VLO13_09715, partial [Halomonas sp.]|nr:hypothetical protein [Halomonas sp.]
ESSCHNTAPPGAQHKRQVISAPKNCKKDIDKLKKLPLKFGPPYGARKVRKPKLRKTSSKKTKCTLGGDA